MKTINLTVIPGYLKLGVVAVSMEAGCARRPHDSVVSVAGSEQAPSLRIAMQDPRPNGFSPFAIERTHPVRAGAQSLT
ncbi:hypothetical protein [Actinoalloteichus hymeniacidonis]|uniref:Uncharacterized protein n=1 Tax=Actinoalloteichus hymeniacidonis TaxID=340345 RepID=A0AAC9HM19_9PSEU|nr:hypothetical protein [Actinoalloteichus hymeniacidonis]AOS61807.1 hypothetical protein TL08_04885 [Actinoalloteichus hymeniacidonis]MBB5910174.1 hypothetical protein [Actinoalloteichus hymeniacidonis]